MKNGGYNICMFAHNEERNIERSIKSALTNSNQNLISIYVIVNGSTDRTRHIVADMKVNHDQIELVELELGDKCNAWNHYTHLIAAENPAKVHFFVDTDVAFTDQAFSVLFEKLIQSEIAVAIAGLPMSGR